MINITEKTQCCGCTACANVCAHNAISMQPDELGFKYPKVDSSKCIDCGLCDKVCAFNDHYDISNNLVKPIAYAARHKDLNEVMKSRSGGAFVSLSDFVLSKGGIIYGAGYKEHFVVCHKRATNASERDEFRGSKYVQSDLDGIFRSIKNDLKKDLWVLFSGTACQVAGLKSFIPKKLQEKLVLIDIVCHGVPSPYIWRDYLNKLENKYGKKIISVNFRDKEKYGWIAHKESYVFEDGKILTADNYTYLFYEEIMLRPSCKVCYFADIIRPGDFTIADFWGYEKTDIQINSDNRGVSLLLCNSQKALDILPSISDGLKLIPSDIKKCLQPNLQAPTKFHQNYLIFPQEYQNKGFDYVMKKYGNLSFRYKLNNTIMQAFHLPRRILSKLFRILN